MAFHLSNASRFLTLTALLTAFCATASAQNTGYVKASVNPGRAAVFVDGKYLGPAKNFGMARKYAVAAGEHEVVLREPRYAEVTKRVTVEPGKTVTLKETLQPVEVAKPPFGQLKTRSNNKFDGVFVNGAYMGHVDEFNNSSQALLLNPGEYTVRIVSPGGEVRQERKVTIQQDQVTLVEVN